VGKRDTEPESDAELWARVARGARPLRKGRAAPSAEPEKRRAKAPAKELIAPRQQPQLKPAAKAAQTARGEALDRQTARQLERGRLPLEARLDLHGMRQREAHAVLRRFLKSAQGEGYRHVLVITGKGAASSDSRSFYAEDDPGVLRQAVPHWLSAPDLAQVIVSYSEAPSRLGGEGALYVRLRRSRPKE